MRRTRWLIIGGLVVGGAGWCGSGLARPQAEQTPAKKPASSGPAHPALLIIESAAPASLAAQRHSGGTLAADWLATPVVRKLAAVMYKEAARTGELIRLPRNHPERELLVRKVSSG